MTTNTMEMHHAIGDYVGEHSPVELPVDTDIALALGRLAEHPVGSEPEIKFITQQAVQQLKDEGCIAVTEKEGIQLVEYIEPIETPEAKPTSYNHIDLFGESDEINTLYKELTEASNRS